MEYRKITVVAPEYAELEPYFISWAERILRYSNELKVEIEAFMTQSCYERILKVGQINKINYNATLKVLESLDDFFHLSMLKAEDLLVIVSSRKGSISFKSELDAFSNKVLKIHEQNDWILVYPGQEAEISYKNYEDVSGRPIGVGVDTLTKIGKEVGNIFKKEE
jgi:hypothetical protein